jgi:20S proteasome alpha/beta subunit
VTVCVAAICNDSAVVGAADRMITAGDVEFEPPQTKIEVITSSIAIMIAGDIAVHVEILNELRGQVAAEISATPTQWLSVKNVANWYYEHFQRARNSRCEHAILMCWLSLKWRSDVFR